MHTWNFFRSGGFDQVQLDTAEDLLHLDELDQKLWVALACPIDGLEFDARTLSLLDADKDGRIRAPELLAAIKWAVSQVKRPEAMLKGEASLPLSDLDPASGAELLTTARMMLTALGKERAAAITLEDATDTQKILTAARFNGDGVVLPGTAEDPEIKRLLEEVIDTVGSVTDCGGFPGVDTAKLDLFFGEAAAYLNWRAAADPAHRVLGDQTAAGLTLVNEVRAKVNDFFTRCRMVAFDARSAVALGPSEADLTALAHKELSAGQAEIAALPLAPITAGSRLPLGPGVNPAWAARMQQLRALVVEPLLGARESLSEADWAQLQDALAPYASWLAAEAGSSVAKLGDERLKLLVAGDGKAKVMALITEDLARAGEVAAVGRVEQLLRYNRDLLRLLQNFISFRNFYAAKEPAIFQFGRLFIDQRSCDLTMKVQDPGKHAALASHSAMFLVYCDIVRKATGEKMMIVAALTDGDADNLMVGRNGLFYDRQGRDWDATITKIVEQPISIRQAFWSPYKKAARLVEEQVEKFAASKDQAASALTTEAVTAGPPAKDAPFDVAKFAGIFAAIGLALGAIGGAAGMILGAFVALPAWQMPLAIGGLMLVISGPSMLLAALKLRQRNLGPLLDANGWAINSKARINIPFGRSLTHLAHLPPGARQSTIDPYAEKNNTGWWLLLLLLAVLAWAFVNGLIPMGGTSEPASTIPEVTAPS